MDDQTSKVRRVTSASPPFNLIGADTVAELSDIVDRLSGEEQVSVVIFDSATPGFFFNHVDSDQIPAIADMAGSGRRVQSVVALDLGGSVGQDARRAQHVDLG
ncbi:hypothetical protein E1258_16325 [Micromonospora sp. KC207]|uniref:hypothetical protein n=1 Tax=Micromonospora sp. KC207 TaxID=2530377 RepID=UPI001047BE98|nr:hypothetical protein [Micromonospora sp. KC207]TDC59907.1 hypothetical protein E1258_16325 [Micromonospora sp. KC207]